MAASADPRALDLLCGCHRFRPHDGSAPISDKRARFGERQLRADCDEKGPLVAEDDVPAWRGRAEVIAWSGGRGLRDGDQLGELTQVLGGGGEEKLVFCSVRASETQAIQLENALEVREQHLDFLPLAP
jgi:hypothetical protein